MKFLIVGLGSMGLRRIRNLRSLDQTQIVGFDKNPARRARCETDAGIQTFPTLERALACGPDVMLICTPPDAHIDYAHAAVNSGLHFFAEHGVSLDGMQFVLPAAKSKDLVAAPSCTMRFHPSIQRMHALVDAGEIGDVLTFTHHCGQYLPDWHPWEDYRDFYASKRKTGGCRELVPFELCWLTWLVGPIARVAAMTAHVSQLEADIDDVYQLIAETERSARGHIQIDVLAQPGVRACRLIGSNGTIEWSTTEKAVRLWQPSRGSWQAFAESDLEVAEGYSGMSIEAMYVEEIRSLIAAIRGDAEYPYSYEQDAHCVDVLLAAEESAGAERFVRIGPEPDDTPDEVVEPPEPVKLRRA